MSYTPGWSVNAGDTPSATKWNELGANDDLLNSRTLTGWNEVTDSWVYSSADAGNDTYTITIPSGGLTKYSLGMRVKFNQSQAFTNTPAAGSNVVFDLSDTSGFKVGDVVVVSSSAGTENATITVVTTNTSITVNTISLTHTSTSPLITYTKNLLVTGVTNTTLTLFGGALAAVANTAISLPYYSAEKAPFGFSLDPNNWTVSSIYTGTEYSQSSPTGNTWYNLGSQAVTVPIGAWKLQYSLALDTLNSSGNTAATYVTLSTGNSTESNPSFTSVIFISQLSEEVVEQVGRIGDIVTTSATQYYLNTKPNNTISFIANRSDIVPTIIRAVSNYL